MNQSVKAGGS